jgi:hypothetical protein
MRLIFSDTSSWGTPALTGTGQAAGANLAAGIVVRSP